MRNQLSQLGGGGSSRLWNWPCLIIFLDMGCPCQNKSCEYNSNNISCWKNQVETTKKISDCKVKVVLIYPVMFIHWQHYTVAISFHTRLPNGNLSEIIMTLASKFIHRWMKVDCIGKWSPEKDCCWGWLMFWQQYRSHLPRH